MKLAKRTTDRLPWNASRVGAAILMIAGLMPLLIGASLVPSPRGVGTHHQLGLAPCGILSETGYPCPSCGMTTSFTLAANGDLAGAFIVQPAGTVLAFADAMLVLLAGYVVVTGSTIGAFVRKLIQRNWRLVAMGLVGLVLAGWAFKMFTLN